MENYDDEMKDMKSRLMLLVIILLVMGGFIIMMVKLNPEQSNTHEGKVWGFPPPYPPTKHVPGEEYFDANGHMK